jgi:hypothetical protein
MWDCVITYYSVGNLPQPSAESVVHVEKSVYVLGIITSIAYEYLFLENFIYNFRIRSRTRKYVNVRMYNASAYVGTYSTSVMYRTVVCPLNLNKSRHINKQTCHNLKYILHACSLLCLWQVTRQSRS